ncbi:hypothetical protein [Tahibacter amnicola]|uniref:Uncharacterized protein n=1 Tax=Tahibacter amnicola TaxID=2976241 RepID=A0ABY6BD22_9GAMM|nr:hypothetical protein [Tahibacter amnicola]UXI67471.1 hypothetical protein N4264_22475 [Tahibacter amnicola]
MQSAVSTHAPVNPPPRPEGFVSRLMTALTAVMTALAAGAAWSAAALWTGRELGFVAVLVGLLVGGLLRSTGLGHRLVTALFAVVLTLAASLYACALLATASVAMVLGLPLQTTMSNIGLEMALAVAWVRLDWLDGLFITAGCVMAALLVARRGKQSAQ